ncbi:MAG: ATP synthase F1 subunit epsilon [Candidatus Kappaea frigidicola]|nr:ATP synthase F1 subunit epsilon [Candidatus Kappaea frigidicola]
MTIKVSIVTPNKILFETENADLVILPGKVGEFGVLKRHTPLLSALKKGKISVRENEVSKDFEISGGFVEVLPDKVTVLAES